MGGAMRRGGGSEAMQTDHLFHDEKEHMRKVVGTRGVCT
jgi:hypothetical protein